MRIYHARKERLAVGQRRLVYKDIGLRIAERELYVILEQVVAMKTFAEVSIDSLNIWLGGIGKSDEGRVAFNLGGKVCKQELEG